MNRICRAAVAAALLMFAFHAQAASTLRVASWNTLHAGYSGSTDWTGYANQLWTDFGGDASAANGLDVVFAQEVMYDTAAASIASALTSVSGVTWTYAVTAAVGRSSYKERYAVIYRTDRVQLLSQYLWSDTGDKFEREPQIVKLRHVQTGADYSFINWHTIFGTTAERQAEVAEIGNVFRSIQDGSSGDQDVILVGDHNADATSSWWANLKGTVPAVGYQVNVATSLNSSCNYVSAYDHFWFQASYVSEFSSAQRDYIADTCAAYALSDHAPINLNLYSSSDTD